MGAILHVIELDRQDPSDAEPHYALCYSVISTITRVDPNPQFYEELVESQILQQTAQFYRLEANRLQDEQPIAPYVNTINKQLQAEEKCFYLPVGTRIKVGIGIICRCVRLNILRFRFSDN